MLIVVDWLTLVLVGYWLSIGLNYQYELVMVEEVVVLLLMSLQMDGLKQGDHC